MIVRAVMRGEMARTKTTMRTSAPMSTTKPQVGGVIPRPGNTSPSPMPAPPVVEGRTSTNKASPRKRPRSRLNRVSHASLRGCSGRKTPRTSRPGNVWGRVRAKTDGEDVSPECRQSPGRDCPRGEHFRALPGERWAGGAPGHLSSSRGARWTFTSVARWIYSKSRSTLRPAPPLTLR